MSRIRGLLPDAALSSDFIAGFCGETETEHADTLSLMEAVRYDQAFLYAYSQRDKTHAARNLTDDVPADVKARRLKAMVAVFRAGLGTRCAAQVGTTQLVLVEGPSRRSPAQLTGRTDANVRVNFPDAPVPASFAGAGAGNPLAPSAGPLVGLAPGDYVAVRVDASTGATLSGAALARTTLAEFWARHGSAAARG